MAGEQTISTSCPGVAEYLVGRHTEVKVIPNAEPVPVQVSRSEYGVISVECPYKGSWNTCIRSEKLPYDPNINLAATCRYALAATHESPDLFVQPFERPSFYQQMWDRLSPQAKTACVLYSPYAFSGSSQEMFEGMCLAFHVSKKPNQVVEELTEIGVMEKMSKLDCIKTALKLLDEGKVEDMEIKNGDRQKAEEIRQRLQKQLRDYDEVQSKATSDSRWQEILPGWHKDMQSPHLRFAPGFQSFVDQFFNRSGFPINFTKPA